MLERCCIVFCKNCGLNISSDDTNFCPKCGSNLTLEKNENKTDQPVNSKDKKISPKKGCLGCLSIIFIFFIILFFIGSFSDDNKSSTTSSQSSSSTKNSSTNTKKNWIYTEKDDLINNNAKIKFAKATSTNKLNFKFPYEGSQSATLIIRKNHDASLDVMVSIEKGQFLTSILGGTAIVRFDDNQPEEFQLLQPQDHSTTVVFIKQSDVFIKKLLSSKKLYFQTTFFNEGNPTLDFIVEGLII